jgi:Flp pilus assembly protein TadB
LSARSERSPSKYPAALVVGIYAISAVLCFAGSLLFVRDSRVAVPLSLLAAVAPCQSALELLAARRTRTARIHLQLLLQHLCAALTSGRSPETALVEALPAMTRFFGPTSGFCRALRTSVFALQSGRPFADAVRSLPPALPCPESTPLFQALASGRILGPRVLDLLRASLAMTTERMLLEQDAAAQSSARRIEALVLAATPFLVALSLQGAAAGFFEPAFADPRGRLALGAVFVVSVAAASLALRIVSVPAKIRSPRPFRSLTPRTAATGNPLPDPSTSSPPPPPLPGWLPAAYARRLLLLFSRSPEDPEAALARHLARLPVRLALGAAVFGVPTLLAGTGPWFIAIAAVAGAGFFAWLHDRDARAAQVERDRNRVVSYPTFLGLVLALLSAGLVLRRALEVAREGLPSSDLAVVDDIDRTLARIRAGRTPADALDRLSVECGVPEIASALSLLAQYDRRGGASTLDLLRLQTSSCWALARAETRRRLDEVSTRLLLPTAVDLLAVIALTGIPALLSLQPLA